MSKFDPNVNYANSGKTEMETLSEAVNSMCAMWNDIAKEMNGQRTEKRTGKIATQQHQKEVHPPTRYSLTAEEIRDIVNANMERDPGTEGNEEEEETNEPNDNSEAPTNTLYDTIFDD